MRIDKIIHWLAFILFVVLMAGALIVFTRLDAVASRERYAVFLKVTGSDLNYHDWCLLSQEERAAVILRSQHSRK